MPRSFKLLAISASVLATGVASASSFVAVSLGTYNDSFGPFYTTTETVLFSTTAPYAPLASLDFKAVYGGAGISSGTAFYTASNGDTLTLEFLSLPFSYFGMPSSIAGNWTFVSGTGSYAMVASGTGSWSASYNALAGALAQTTFVGEFIPVPEPASVAAIAVGLGALAARRRRKSA